MNVRAIGLALAAGIATFLIIGAAVSEYTLQWIEFSVFVGIPVGIVSGALVAAAVYLGLSDEAPARRRRIARSIAVFGVAFLLVLMIANVAFGLGVILGMVVAAVVGALAAIVSFLRDGTSPDVPANA